MHKSRRIHLLSLFILLPFVLQAQIHVSWSRTIEEVSGAWNAATAHDGGYIIVNIDSVVKIDTAGNVEWYRNYDVSIWNLVQAPDSGYVLLGEKRSQEWNNSFVVELIRTDNSGNIIWSRTYGDSTDNEARAICTTDDGGYAVATESYNGNWVDSDIWLLRLNSMGDTLWTHHYDINNNSFDDVWFYKCLSQTDDDGFVMTGYTQDPSTNDCNMFLIKTGSMGDVEWVNTYGEENNDELGYTLRVLDSGYLMGGYCGSPVGYLIKVDLYGNIIWERIYNKFRLIKFKPLQISGGWLLYGSTKEFGDSDDAYIIQIDTNGVIQWETTIGTDSTDEYGGPIFPVGNNTYVMLGSKQRHLWITQFTVDSTTGTVANPRLPLPESVHLFENYPNPFNSATTITYELPAGEWKVRLSVYDLSGRFVRTLVQSAKSGGVYRAEWDGRDQKGNPVASGVYLSHLTVESPAEGAISTKTRKMILLR